MKVPPTATSSNGGTSPRPQLTAGGGPGKRRAPCRSSPLQADVFGPVGAGSCIFDDFGRVSRLPNVLATSPIIGRSGPGGFRWLNAPLPAMLDLQQFRISHTLQAARLHGGKGNEGVSAGMGKNHKDAARVVLPQ